MLRRLLLLNVVLGGVALASAAFIVWELLAPWPLPEARPPVAPPAAPAAAPVAPPAPASAYNVVATRNVFSPARAEGPATAAGGGGLGAPKPSLYGVVLRDQNPIAYLEDPQTKRVAGYRVGDAIAGGTLKTIGADRVIIARPEGLVDVKLHDPSKPRPAAAAPAPTAVPGVPGPLAPGVAVPGVSPQLPAVIQGRPGTPPQVQRPPGVFPGTMVGPFTLPGARPAPGLGRRVPAPPAGAAPPAALQQ